MIVTIQLENIVLHSKTGWYEEEHIIGNDLEISISLEMKLTKKIKDLADTVNYVTVYDIAKKHSYNKGQLLEKLAASIMDEISHLDKRIHKITVGIKKLQAPIPNFIGTVGITLSKKY